CVVLATTMGISQSAELRSRTSSIYSKGHIAHRHTVSVHRGTAGRSVSRVRATLKTPHGRGTHKLAAHHHDRQQLARHHDQQQSARHESGHSDGLMSGIASVYSDEKTANGEYAYASRLTAAHRSLPFGT